VLESKVNKFETDTFVKDPVVALIEFVDIELVLLIFCDDIFDVCKLPVLIILLLVVNKPEIVKLLQVDIFVAIIIIRENYFSLVKRNVINTYFNFY
jgi:hypothetical protein